MSYQFHDVFGLDDELLGLVPQPCVAILLLFPINQKVFENNNVLCMYFVCMFWQDQVSYSGHVLVTYRLHMKGGMPLTLFIFTKSH